MAVRGALAGTNNLDEKQVAGCHLAVWYFVILRTLSALVCESSQCRYRGRE